MSIGVGIAGWGAISEQLHGPCLSGMEECEIVAVCDEREERLAHAADTYRVEDTPTWMRSSIIPGWTLS